MFKVPPKFMLRKGLKKQVTLKRYSFSENEDAYGQSQRSLQETFTLEAEIQEITAEDLAYLVPGTAEIGDAYGFFLPTYLKKGREITIQVEDEITWNNKTWRIERIEDFYYGDKLWYKRAFLKRVI